MRRILSAREAYKYWAETFDRGTPILALESRVLAPILSDSMPPGARFLDVGCGTGRWLEWAMERGAHASGTDLSVEMLFQAARKPRLRGRIVQADAMLAPFRDAAADVVLCALVIGHMRPIDRAMDALARLAAPGGRVILTDFHPDALRRGWKRTFRSGVDTIERESDPYPIDQLKHPALALEDFREVPFGEEERHFFEAAAKADWFDENRNQPAILIAHYRRLD
jgi:ubiquinone/menaquinone biosynthesis C-methylase UbiE